MPRTDMLITRPEELVPVAHSRADGWSNAISSVGTVKDKRRHFKYASDAILTKEALCSQYIGDGLVTRIIDALPEDMTREWGYFENDDDADGEKKTDCGLILSEMLRLDAPTHFREAEKWARLLGGSLIFIGAMDGQPLDKPLKIEKIKNIEFLKVFDLGDIYTSECKFNTDLTSPEFGKVEIYKVRARSGITAQDAYIHASRCIPVYGTRVPFASAASLPFEYRHWGIPIMQYIYDDLRDYRGVFSSTAAILNEFILGKYKFSDLDEMLAQGNEAALRTRIDAIDQCKSILNAVILGTDEDYIRDSATVTGISDLLDRFMMNLAAVTGYPVTKLFGRSASGLNATGEGDSKNYYDRVRSRQNEFTPYIQTFGKIIATWKGKSDAIQWKWKPLAQLTEEQLANKERIESENFRTKSDGYQKYMQEGVLTPEEVYGLEFEPLLGKKEFEEFDPMDAPPMTDPMGNPIGNPEGQPGIPAKPAVAPTKAPVAAPKPTEKVK